MIRVTFVIDELHTTADGGSETQLVRLLRGLDPDRFAPRLVCLHASPWAHSQGFRFPVIDVGVSRLRSARFLRAARRVGSLLRSDHTDIIQSCFFDSDVFGALAARFSGGAALVWSRRNLGHLLRRGDALLLRAVRPRRTWYLGNSRAAIAHAVAAEGAPPHRTAVIPNGLDVSRFDEISGEPRRRQRAAWGFSDRETLIGITANLRAVKNLESPMRVVAGLAREFPDLRLVLVGEGDMRAPLERLREDLGARALILLPGQTSDVLPCLAAFDLALLTSTAESLSNSVMEYLSAGLPTIVSRVGGNPELVSDGENGLLYDVGNDRQLGDCIRRLLRDPALARRLGDRARHVALERFSYEACIRAHEALYERIARSVRRRAATAPPHGRRSSGDSTAA